MRHLRPHIVKTNPPALSPFGVDLCAAKKGYDLLTGP